MTTLEQLQFEAQQFAAAMQDLATHGVTMVEIRKAEYEFEIMHLALDNWKKDNVSATR